MKKLICFLTIILFAGLTYAAGFDISEDGHTTAKADGTPGQQYIITDVVPLPIEPDYVCSLRMQVGGLDFGDFDNDGDPDLAVGCYHSQSYPPYEDWRNFLLINNNGQLETTPTWFSFDMRSTTDVRWADFNGDDYLDLFAANGDFSFDYSVIYFGSSGGLATNPGWTSNTGAWTLYGAPFDFDHDGDIDLATANQGVSPDPYRPIYLYHNTGNGLPDQPTWQSADQMITNNLDWGDMDGDGWEDLAASKWANFQSGVYANNNGNITGSPVWQDGSTRSEKGIGWADVDDDSYPELAIGASAPTWLFDNVDGVLGTTPIWQSSNSFHGCQDLAWGDIDGDGDPDLATVHFSNGHLRIYLNVDGTLESTPSWQHDGYRGTALAFADINGDGHLDLAMGESGEPSVKIFLNTSTTSVEDNIAKPDNYTLKQNYPNPFNASTTIEFELAQAENVTISVYNLLGRHVTTITSGEYSSGAHSVIWNADDVTSGIYFYRLSTSKRTETRRMVLLK
ncbi:MAG: T9SS type A sorting domain-containing protein [Candidatus Zixiibacteriota bacterium]|nr:MAG: T9SS type A sorting domain-containing protein [candidate division Zixibacteria bacterium]